MHWMKVAASQAGLPAADQVTIANGSSSATAWDTGGRTLGLSPRDLAARLAPALGVHPANFDAAQPRALVLLPEAFARRYQVYPLREDDRTITVATSDPTNLDTEQAVSFVAGRRTIFELAPPHAISEAINAGYSPDRAVEKLLSSVGEHIADAVRVVEEVGPETVTANDTAFGPVVKLTSLIIHDAIALGASDVHIEPGPKGGTVRLRIDGVMRVHMHIPMGALNRIVSRIKVMSKLDIADRMRPQDGRARVSVDGATYDLRVSTVPTREAEKAVIRVLRPDTAKTLSSAGLGDHELVLLRQLLGAREGIVLVTGPTGSGKTTTLYAALREVAERGVNITTVEDPVEYELPGITQMQVDTKRGVSFASALRAILRQDPDVIFVGEIRDLDTAGVAVQAALTGHLVLATLHTNDALGSVARLEDIGLDRASISASLRGAVAQRLVRRVCPECARPTGGVLTEEESRLATAFGVRPPIRATGCGACGNTGYRGRLPVAEVAIITPILSEMIGANASSSNLTRAAIDGGMRSLREAALDRVRAGETTLQEVERVVGDAGAHHETGVREPAAALPDQSADKPRVLIVEDDAVMRHLASSLLRNAGYPVETANDGAAALERVLTGEAIGLIITDLHMPTMGGADLLKAVRASTEAASIPVIVLTGSDHPDEETLLIDAGADDYIRKPINPERFVARVRAALRRASL
jgi:type II secretory ATPase GspE/PulE/Tfp pilus assembly ATPase PilB-like protein/ActR/RegA family two-component response regulator